MTSIAELEHRLQLAQEAKADAERSYRLHEFREQRALEALTAARVAEETEAASIRSRPASPLCQSGGRAGCTCSRCF